MTIVWVIRDVNAPVRQTHRIPPHPCFFSFFPHWTLTSLCLRLSEDDPRDKVSELSRVITRGGVNCTTSSLKIPELRKFPSSGPRLNLALGQGSHSSQTNITVLQAWPEGLPPGPAGPGKGMETLGSLLVAPSLTLTTYKAEQGWLPSLLCPVRSRGKR